MNTPDLWPYVALVIGAVVVVGAAALGLCAVIIITGGFRDKNRGTR